MRDKYRKTQKNRACQYLVITNVKYKLRSFEQCFRMFMISVSLEDSILLHQKSESIEASLQEQECSSFWKTRLDFYFCVESSLEDDDAGVVRRIKYKCPCYSTLSGNIFDSYCLETLAILQNVFYFVCMFNALPIRI